MNNNIKALFFAQYLWQRVFMTQDWESFNDNRAMPVDPVYIRDGDNRLNSGYLLLRSIDQLTDEEWKEFKGKSSHGEQTYLRLIGVLTQFAYLDETEKMIWLSEADIIAKGWAQYQTA